MLRTNIRGVDKRTIYGKDKPLPGDTIELLHMSDDWDPILPAGTKGIVKDITTQQFGSDYGRTYKCRLGRWEDFKSYYTIR